MLISEAGYQLSLHALVLVPQLELRQIDQRPGPEPQSEFKEQYVRACWAPDGSGVCLCYDIGSRQHSVEYEVGDSMWDTVTQLQHTTVMAFHAGIWMICLASCAGAVPAGGGHLEGHAHHTA